MTVSSRTPARRSPAGRILAQALAGLLLLAGCDRHPHPDSAPLPAVAPPSRPEAVVAGQPVHYEYYDLHGRYVWHLRAALQRHSREKGYVGLTRTNIGWKLSYRPERQGCSVRRVEVDLQIAIVLPRWVEAEAGSRRLQQKWHRYVAEVHAHELEHAGYAVAAAQGIAAAIRSLDPAPDCKTLLAEAWEAADAVLARYRAQDTALDERARREGPFF